MWTIFDNPLDYPGKFVVRAFDIVRGDPEPRPRLQAAVCDSLERARASVPGGLYCQPRDPDDHPSIVEVWF